MNTTVRHLPIVLAALVASAAMAWPARPAAAQMPTPEIGYVYPAGGGQGTTFRVTFGGQRLRGAEWVSVSGPGVSAKVVEVVPRIGGKEATELREKLQELRKVKDKDEKTRQEILEIARKLLTFNRRTSPALAEMVTVEVTVAPDAEPGNRQIRLATPAGVSNPLVFCVDQLPEAVEREDQARKELRNFLGNRYGVTIARDPAEDEMPIVAPVVVNGQITPGDVDRYRLTARKGEQLVVAVQARELIPYLADAVPGWFQPTVAVLDSHGNEVAYQDDFRFDPDPMLRFTAPADGDYVVVVNDAIYRGREDFVYRLRVGPLPVVTSVFPLGCKAGQATAIQVTGWNLPADATVTNDPGRGPGVYPIRVRSGKLLSRPMPFVVGDLDEALEQPAAATDAGQRVALPIVVNGRIANGGERDTFGFAGKAGQKVVVEVHARRLGSPLDAAVTLLDDAGKAVAFADDCEDPAQGLMTHHADPCLTATLPADGQYRVRIADVTDHGGPEYGYRLRISPPRPGFELRVAPSCITARGGAYTPITVQAIRRDGFAGPIALSLTGADGFFLDGGTIPAGQDKIICTLLTPPKPTLLPQAVRLVGKSKVARPAGEAGAVTAEAAPADLRMQAFAYNHLVVADDFSVFVPRRGIARSRIVVQSELPVQLTPGGKATVRIDMPASRLGEVALELADPPEGLRVVKTTRSNGVIEATLQCDATCKPGLRGNFIFNASMQAPASADGKQPARKQPLGVLPAVPFEVVTASEIRPSRPARPKAPASATSPKPAGDAARPATNNRPAAGNRPDRPFARPGPRPDAQARRPSSQPDRR